MLHILQEMSESKEFIDQITDLSKNIHGIIEAAVMDSVVKKLHNLVHFAVCMFCMQDK